MSRRQSVRVQEDIISEELIANIPVVGGASSAREATTFAIEHEEVIYAPPGAPEDALAVAAEDRGGEPALDGSDASPAPALSPGAAIAAQLRYDLGEAFARELDRAEQSVAAAMADMEARLTIAEAELATARAEVERERAAREGAESRLKAFKELALR